MIFCEECGAKLEDGAKFCEECGAVLEPMLEVNASELKSSEEADVVVHKGKIHGQGKKMKIIVAACLALCTVCLGGVILWGTITKKENRGNNVGQSQVAQNTEKNIQSSECLNTENLCEDESENESEFSTEKQAEVETEQNSEPIDDEKEEDMYTSNPPYDEENEGENTYVDDEEDYSWDDEGDYPWDDEGDYSWDDEEYDWDYDYSNGNDLCAGRYVPSDGTYGELSFNVYSSYESWPEIGNVTGEYGAWRFEGEFFWGEESNTYYAPFSELTIVFQYYELNGERHVQLFYDDEYQNDFVMVEEYIS